MTDHRIEVGDDPDRVQDITAADLLIRLDAHDAHLTQGRHPTGEEIDRLEAGLGYHRLHDIELELTRLGGEGQRDVIADDLEADLVDHLRDHRVDLGGHDRGAGLTLGQPDLPQPRTGPGGQQAQVIADLGELDRQALDGRVHGDVGTRIARGLQQVLRSPNIQTGDLTQVLNNGALVVGRGVESCTDRGGTEVHLQEQRGIVAKPIDLLLKKNGEGLELLTQAHGDGVLELGAPHLQDVDELSSLGTHGGNEALELLDEGVDEREQSQAESGRVGVVRRL